MKLERINTAKGFSAKRSQRISELHRNTLYLSFSLLLSNRCTTGLLSVRWIISTILGVSNWWDSGGRIICWELCQGLHGIFDLEFYLSPGNNLSNVARSGVDLQKRSLPSKYFHLFAHRFPEIE